MYKVIELGSNVKETGEPRVRLLDTSFIKTASTDIQKFWDTLSPSDRTSYLWVIGVSAYEYYGCNNNGDAFYEKDLRRVHGDFVTNANVFLHHVNRDPKKGIGKPIFSWYNEDMHRIELILALDKTAFGAAETVQKLKDGEQLYVSMGCSVIADICSICGHKSKNRMEYCDHLRYNMKKILDDGRQVFAFNPNPKFFDISIVRKPADPTAYALDKIASEKLPEDANVNCTELSDRYVSELQKNASLLKLSEILKYVDGVISDVKHNKDESDENDSNYDDSFKLALKHMISGGFKGIEDPSLDTAFLNRHNISPAGLLSITSESGMPTSLSDLCWASAKDNLCKNPDGSTIGKLLSILPNIINIIRDNDFSVAADNFTHVFSKYNGELDNQANRSLIIRAVKPIARIRIEIQSNMPSFNKLGSVEDAPIFGRKTYARDTFGGTPFEVAKNAICSDSPNYAHHVFVDSFGNRVKVSSEELRNNYVRHFVTTPKGVGTLLALGAACLALTGGTSRKLLATALTLPAAALFFGTPDELSGMTRSTTGAEVPVGTVMQSWKKTAGVINPGKVFVYGAAATPLALAADYAYNRWKYGPYVEEDPNNPTWRKNLLAGGRIAMQHPFGTSLGAATAGGILANLLRVKK